MRIYKGEISCGQEGIEQPADTFQKLGGESISVTEARISTQ